MRSAVLLALAVATAAHADVAPPPPAEATPPPPALPVEATPPPPGDVIPAGPRRYTLDAKKSSFVVQVFKAGAASALAHDHVIHATGMYGTVVLDAADRSSATVEVTVPTKSLVNDDPVMRKRFGLEGEINEKDRAAILANMRHPDQLDVEVHPTITFKSTSVQAGAGTMMTLNGILTIRGKSKAISMPVDVSIKGNTIDGKGTIRLKTSDFGIEPYSAFLGAVKNQDQIILHVRLVATAD
jgi:polyisoprenoid-binding protein YceI